MESKGIDRRTVLRGGAYAAAGLAFGGRLFDAAPAYAAQPAELDLSQGSTNMFSLKTIKPGRRMESFAFDHKNRKLFAATLRDNNRDIEVVQISTYGNPQGDPMIVRNAGHGYAFGVEGIGSSSYIWIEHGAEQRSENYWAGTRVARFRYWHGRDTGSTGEGTLEGTFGGDQSILSGSDNVTCSVDGLFDYGDGKPRLAVRRQTADGPTRFEVYRLNGVTSAPVLEWAQRPNAIDGTVQGWTLYGNVIYCLTNDFNTENIKLWKLRPQEPKSTNYATSLRIQVLGPRNVGNPAGHDPQEAEGIAVYSASATEYRTCFGITKGGSSQLNSIFYRPTNF